MGTSIYLSEKFDTEDYLKNMRDKSFSYQMKKYKSCVTASDYAMLCKLVWQNISEIVVLTNTKFNLVSFLSFFSKTETLHRFDSNSHI